MKLSNGPRFAGSILNVSINPKRSDRLAVSHADLKEKMRDLAVRHGVEIQAKSGDEVLFRYKGSTERQKSQPEMPERIVLSFIPDDNEPDDGVPTQAAIRNAEKDMLNYFCRTGLMGFRYQPDA